MQDYVILIDLSDTVSHALARKLRSEGIYCRIMPRQTAADEVLHAQARGVILAADCGVSPADFPQMVDYLQAGLPMLCLGSAALTLCTALGGSLGDEQESGITTVHFDQADSLFADAEDGERYLPLRRGMVFTDTQGSACATADETPLGLHVRQRDVWGLAFPLERNDPVTTQLLLRFCVEQCGCTQWWNAHAFIDLARAEIVEGAADGDAICALSGGVDSGVCALLGQQALGQRLHCIFVDTGLLREGEADEVMDAYQNQLGLNVRRVDARAEFLLALRDVTDQAEKERIVSRLMRELLRRESEAIADIRLFIRGTNYADQPSEEDDALLPGGCTILEPVRTLFKDEIRQVGETLGMPPALISRQPFPGSGLATRIMTSVDAERLALTRTADTIFRREVEELGLQKRLWQYYAALAPSPLPDGGVIVILRAVQAAAGAAGLPARLPSDLLERVTAQVMEACPEVQRVFYDCTPSISYARTAGK